MTSVINNIRPHIDNLVIHPISLTSGPSDVAYAVEIPQSTTAHQALDHRYYKRFNFLSEPMEDYEVRDTMNRATRADVDVEFSYKDISIANHEHHYMLVVIVKNLGAQLVNNFQLEFSFPNGIPPTHILQRRENLDYWPGENKETIIQYRSNLVLFPNQHRDVGRELGWRYQVNTEMYNNVIRPAELQGEPLRLNWTLWADDMPTKQGTVPFKLLNKF